MRLIAEENYRNEQLATQNQKKKPSWQAEASMVPEVS